MALSNASFIAVSLWRLEFRSLEAEAEADAVWEEEIESLSAPFKDNGCALALDLDLEQFEEEKGNLMLDKEFAVVAKLLLLSTSPQSWSANPKLFCLLEKVGRGDLFDQFLEASLTDLWLPLPRRTIRRFLKNDTVAKLFTAFQTAWFDERLPTSLEGQHRAIVDPDNLELNEVKLLGAGGYGEVHSVQHHGTSQLYALKTMSRPVIHKHHVDLMNDFRREINGMRRAKYHHCVTLEASFTDTESVRLLCSLVAEMDLSVLLHSEPIPEGGVEILQHAIGCITSALAYLHNLNIRHDDLKPNNILIYRKRILLTDFGFCLDTTDSDISTTTGPPAHLCRRYSAPEVTDQAPRSRLTDIWSLGCVLFEIMSRLCGHNLSTMNDFWLRHGIRYNSYAENREATRMWYETLVADRSNDPDSRRKILMISFIYHIILEPERLLRPTATLILNKWKDFDYALPTYNGSIIGTCCNPLEIVLLHTYRPGLTCWPMLDVLRYDRHLAYIFFDLQLNTVGWSENLGKPNALNPTLLSIPVDSSLRYELESNFETSIRNFISDRLRSMPSTVSTSDGGDMSNISPKELVKSLYLHPYRYSHAAAYPLRIPRPGSDLSYVYTVQFTVLTMQLEKRASHGRPLLVMIFDPTEHEQKRWYIP